MRVRVEPIFGTEMTENVAAFPRTFAPTLRNTTNEPQ
jgi:hypothetical protein